LKRAKVFSLKNVLPLYEDIYDRLVKIKWWKYND
jgi:hypothetical protein